MEELLVECRKKAESWLASPVIDETTKLEIKKLIDAGGRELIDAFYKDLEFGTGGLRGLMIPGSNGMNRYTVGIATQGLANYLNKTFPDTVIRVAIAHDSRNNSRYFAEVTAGVFSANGIEVHLFPELRPTPLLSYAIRKLGCQSGVVITASHNPKEYNGYKAYWNDGAQVVPPHDKNIIAEVKAITSFEQVQFTANTNLIKSIGPELEASYYQEVRAIIPNLEVIKKHATLPLVYSSLHGAGITMVPECLRQIGFETIHVVAEQAVPDGNFPTVDSPNPEEASAMALAIAKGKATGATLVMATDPDTDRVGIGVRKPDGEFVLLNGNQAFSVMIYFILTNLPALNKPYIAKTIVTTELIDTMAAQLGVTCYNTLTGFKYIAELMRQKEGLETFVAAGEESYGYMAGDFVRDKDAVSACAFFSAMAASAADMNQSLYEWMIDMYVRFGFYKEHLINLVRKGQQGEQEIRAMMHGFRNNPPKTINGIEVVTMLDYQTGTITNIKTQVVTKLEFAKSDVLQYYLADGSKVSVRPSGTEPKIKFYLSVNSELKSAAKYDEVEAELEARLVGIGAFVNP